jgi:cytochrome b561
MSSMAGERDDDLSLAIDAARQRHAMRSYRTPAKVFHWITVGLVAFMVSSAVIAKQLVEGPVSDTLFTLHKATGIMTLVIVLLRIGYRLLQWWTAPAPQVQGRSALHWSLYVVVVLVPLLGWSGVSAFGSREVFPGLVVPEIWPQNGAHADLLFQLHAYAAFGLLALVALHIGFAMQDYMMRADAPRRDPSAL